MAYKDLKELQRKNQWQLFHMAATYIMDCGHRNILQLTDEDIDKMEGNGLMSQEFVQAIAKLGREICKIASPTEVIQFCQAEELFDITFYAEKPTRDMLNSVIQNLVCMIQEKSFEETTLDEIADYIDVDVEDLEEIMKG